MGPYIQSLVKDPRHYQITVLSALLRYGIGWLDFEIRLKQVLDSRYGLLTQYACTHIGKIPSFDARSPLISGISLCLVLHAGLTFGVNCRSRCSDDRQQVSDLLPWQASL
jgi:hypothetical protein